FLAGLQPHVRLLPVRAIAGETSAAPLFSRIIRGAHRVHLHFEDRLDGFLDLRLGRLLRHLEHERVLVFLDGQALLRNDRTAKNLVCRFHYATSAAFSCRVRRRGTRVAFFSPPPVSALCCRFEAEPLSESWSFSIAGCVKITWL